MSTQAQTAIPTAPPPGARPATASGLVPYRLTVRQFLKMIDAGIFRDTDHVELLGGLLVDKMVKHDPHDFAIDMLGTNLDHLLPPDWIAREEKSVVLGRFWRRSRTSRWLAVRGSGIARVPHDVMISAR